MYPTMLDAVGFVLLVSLLFAPLPAFAVYATYVVLRYWGPYMERERRPRSAAPTNPSAEELLTHEQPQVTRRAA